MRTLIFALLLFAMNAFAAPQPNVWVNPWSTNRSPMPVMATNTLSVSNVIPGGNGSNWLFYGIDPRTVATLGELSQSQVWTNDGTFIRPSGPTNQAIFIRRDGSIYIGTNTYQDVNMFNFNRVNPIWVTTMVSSNEPNDIYAQLGVIDNENDFNFFSFSSLDVKSDYTQNFGYSYHTYNAHLTNGHESLIGIKADPSPASVGGIGSYIKISEDKNDGMGIVQRAILAPGDSDPYVWDTDSFRTSGAIEYTRNFGTNIFQVFWDGRIQAEGGATILGPQTNSGTLDVTDTLTTYGGITDLAGISELGVASFGAGVKFGNMTAGKLASYINISGATYLSNSIYSDSDIANALAGLASTNIYILTNKGTGYFTQLYSPTNTAQSSNQVSLTVNTPAGPSTNVFELKTNNTTVLSVNSNGWVGILTNKANQALDVIGNIHASGSITNSGSFEASGASKINNSSFTIGTGGGGTFATITMAGGVQSTLQYNNSSTRFEFLTAATSGFYFDNRVSMKTNSAFIAPISGQVIFCTSNYDVYIITPTKTNLFATGQ